MKRLLVAATAVAALTGCSTDDEPVAESSSSPSPSSPSTSTMPATTPATSTAEPEEGVRRLVVPPAADAMPDRWREVFVIPYGPGKSTLGTAPGGDSGSLDIGPEYGAPGPDGTWWFLDLAKSRIAHYDAAGRFLDQVRISPPWQLPHVLADGTFYAARFDPDGSRLLQLDDGVLAEIAVTAAVAPTYDDGAGLYGFDGDQQVVVDPRTGVVAPVEGLRTPSGMPFSMRMDFDRARLTIELPESGVSTTLPTRTSSGAKARVGLQVRAGADDTIHLLLVGAGADDESVQLVGYTSVSPTGVVTEVEPLADPFSAADPGSPGQLVIAPGSSTPMLVYVLEDGVHVYERVGS